MQFNSMAELAKYVNEKAQNALLREVAETVKEVMHEEVHRTVYDVYEPKKYVRLGDSGGLSDVTNMDSALLPDGTLVVRDDRDNRTDATYSGFRDVAMIVESGQGYQHKVPSVLTDGRSFTELTEEELAINKQHVQAMKAGLIRQGLDVK